jgi:DNA-binding NarL/FixJ family response regulator
VRIVIADDQPDVRAGLRDLFSTVADVEIVGEASNGREAIDVTKALRPDITLMDIRMPVMDGITATKAICGDRSSACVLVLTTFDEDRLVRDSIAAGAAGYLLKGTPLEDMLSIFSLALRGYTGISKGRREESELIGKLSAREREILALVGEGMTNRDIAQRLFLTEGTVRNYITNILATLGARHRTQAALMWRSRA